MATLKSDYRYGSLGKEINNLALTFVTPLAADNYDVFSHLTISLIYTVLDFY